MAWIDNLLSIVVERGADELRVVAGHEPQMFASGVPRRLSIPKMSERDIRELLGGLLSADLQATVEREGRAELSYESAAQGPFRVTLTREDGLSVAFLRTPVAPVAPLASLALASAPVGPSMAPSAVRPSVETSSSVGCTLPLVADAARMRASDLHLADGEVPLVRVDGALRRLGSAPITDVAALVGLGPGERELLDRNGSIDLGKKVDGVGRVRVHAYHAAGGLAAAVRLLPDAAPRLAKLGMPVPLDDLVMLPHGLVLASGPAGAGKSTTLAALAQEALLRRSIVLVSLEDPIEYSLTASESSVLRRRQVGRDVPDFASGLRDALREDPDVLVVGEMRDPETIALALTAAETGHLVLASIHSRSAASAVQRICDSYPPERQQQIRAQLADALSAVVSQRLIRTASVAGRVPVVEIFRVTHAGANLVREGRTAQIPSLIQAGRREGMLSLERCLADRVRAGEITVEDARGAANDAGSLSAYLAESPS